MMAHSHRRVHPAITFLMRTFAPADVARAPAWSAKLERRGERVRLSFDLPDDDALRVAEKLARSAPALRLVAVGGKAIDELSAEICDDVLVVSALLVRAS
jgi:hypothetical protein